MNLELDPKTTALVLIDLQQAIVSRTLQPHSAADVVGRCAALANDFRKAGAMVVYVRVDIANVIKVPADSPTMPPNVPPPPPEASHLVPESGVTAGDVVVVKRSWGAFESSDIETHLLSKGIKTIVIGGIATNYGVESTARSAVGRGFAVVFVENAMSTMSSEMHEFAMKTIFPRLGRVRCADQIDLAT